MALLDASPHVTLTVATPDKIKTKLKATPKPKATKPKLKGTKPKPKPSVTPKSPAATGSLVRKKKKLHLRTRELMRFRCQNLELDIMNLRQEIAGLERSRELMRARTLNRPDDLDGSVLKTIYEFYNLMRHGYRDYVWLEQSNRGPLDFRQFMHTSFDPVLAIGLDVAHRAPRGRDQLMAMLGHMTALTGRPNVQMIDMQIQRARDGRTATVIVHTVCTSPLSVRMLDAKFTHVWRHPQLREKLVGRVISAYGEARYVFDLKTKRIILANIQADHAAAILEVVDSPDEYAFLTGESRFAELVDVTEAESVSSSTSIAPETEVEEMGVKVHYDHKEAAPKTLTTRATMSLSFLLSADEPTNYDK